MNKNVLYTPSRNLGALVVLDTLLLFTPQKATAPAPFQTSTISLPLLFQDSRPLIRVMVNGQGPFLFAIDTGTATKVIVDTQLAFQLKLQISGTNTCADTSGRNPKTLDTAELDSLTIGARQFRGLTASILNLNPTPAMPTYDGVLGFTLFEEYLMTLDYPAKRLHLEKGTLGNPDGKTILPLKRFRDLPAIEILVQNQPVVALLDSGNVVPRIVIAAPLAQKLIYSRMHVGALFSARTACNSFTFSETKMIGNILVGKYIFATPTIVWAPNYPSNNIGNYILKDFVVTFDQQANRVRFSQKFVPVDVPVMDKSK